MLTRVLFLQPLSGTDHETVTGMSPSPEAGSQLVSNNNPQIQDLSNQVNYQSPTSLERRSTAVRFVLFLGLEGVGHHFWQGVMDNSPMKNRLNALKIAPLQIVWPHLYSRGAPACEQGIFSANECVVEKTQRDGSVSEINLDFTTAKDLVANDLQKMAEMAESPQNASAAAVTARATLDNPLYIPLNVLESRMMSYPANLNVNRVYQHPQLHLLYDACAKAGVSCDMVYLYRNPYSVIKSTVLNRPHNPHVLTAIQLYVTMLSVMHYQMLRYPDAVAGCWDFNSVLPTSHDSMSQTHQHESVRNMLGWGDDLEAYSGMLKRIYPHQKTLNKTQQELIVAPNFQSLMDNMVEMSENVARLCQRLYSDNENGGKKRVSQTGN